MGVALEWLWVPNWLPTTWLCGGFVVALGGLWTPDTSSEP